MRPVEPAAHVVDLAGEDPELVPGTLGQGGRGPGRVDLAEGRDEPAHRQGHLAAHHEGGHAAEEDDGHGHEPQGNGQAAARGGDHVQAHPHADRGAAVHHGTLDVEVLVGGRVDHDRPRAGASRKQRRGRAPGEGRREDGPAPVDEAVGHVP